MQLRDQSDQALSRMGEFENFPETYDSVSCVREVWEDWLYKARVCFIFVGLVFILQFYLEKLPEGYDSVSCVREVWEN